MRLEHSLFMAFLSLFFSRANLVRPAIACAIAVVGAVAVAGVVAIARTTAAPAAAQAPAQVTNPAPAPAAVDSAAVTRSARWDRLAHCESSGNWAADTGNGFSGGLQLTRSTWRAYGGRGEARDATREEQITVAERVLADQGWKAWPACSAELGLR